MNTIPVIRLIWNDDDQAGWTAESDDIPGLVLESGSLDALIEKVRFAVPDLLKETQEMSSLSAYPLKFVMERVAGAYVG
ncbi:hypothetical protein FACS1894172_10140 [Spirochaetia bacterium]|nr:hypothetical protein FACS1894164_10260 [Spirochaetia bacterium]GHU32821.1 hypothetical protein FACS1894172_10140 [Spirochaetia bacterium]